MSNKSIYGEIRNDYFDDIENKWFIDAWKTDDDNEEGTVIAKIDHDTLDVTYIDPAAKTDVYAQEVITETIAHIKNNKGE